METEAWHYTAQADEEGRIGMRLPGAEQVLSRDEAEKLHQSLSEPFSKQAGVVGISSMMHAESEGSLVFSDETRLQYECHRCINEYRITTGSMPLNMVKMILCPKCGNKRCPHASDHRNACTQSNEPGQIGSLF